MRATGDTDSLDEQSNPVQTGIAATFAGFDTGGKLSAEQLEKKLVKLQTRIKNTSSVRFSAAKRVRFNYNLAQLTVVMLSLWAIVISTTLAFEVDELFNFPPRVVQLVGILLPVGIVTFNLIENGEVYLRSAYLEMNARQLRELSDQLYVAIEEAKGNATDSLKVYGDYSQRYNDILERSPINHDDIDHWSRKYVRDRQNSKNFSSDYWKYLTLNGVFIVRRQAKRLIYVTLWILPAFLFAFT